MPRSGLCRLCGRVFADIARGPVSGACPEHREEYRSELSRLRLERWAAKQAEGILRRERYRRSLSLGKVGQKATLPEPSDRPLPERSNLLGVSRQSSSLDDAVQALDGIDDGEING